MNTFGKSFFSSWLGALLFCAFLLQPVTALLRNASALKQLARLEKGADEPVKEKQERDNQGEQPAAAFEPMQESVRTGLRPAETQVRRHPLREMQGCPGPVLQVATPPPDYPPVC